MFADERLTIDGAFAERRFLAKNAVPIVDKLLDDEAPPPIVAFIIGGVSVCIHFFSINRFYRGNVLTVPLFL